MSNYLSTPQQYSSPLPTYNFQILSKGLQYKQAQIDTNVAAIQSQIDQYANIDLYRGVDRQYLGQKITDFVSHTNSLEGADWSSKNTTNILRGHISNLVDENIINAAASTKSIRAAQAQIADVKKNHPDWYSPSNEYMSLRGIDQYLANPEVGVKFTAAQYTPWHDVNAEMKPYMENLQKYYPDIKKTYRGEGDLEGYFITEEGKELTPQEVRDRARGLLSQKAKTQLQIDGVYNYTRGENAVETVLKPNFDILASKDLEQYDLQIKNNQLLINSPQSTENDKQAARLANNQLSAIRDERRSQYAQISNNPDQMAYMLQENSFLNSTGNLYSIEHRNSTVSNDTGYWAKKRYELDVAKFQYEKDKDTQENINALRLVTPTIGDEPSNQIDSVYSTINQASTGLSAFVNSKLNEPSLQEAKTTWEEDYNKLSNTAKKGLSLDQYFADRMKQSGYLTIADKKIIDQYNQTINANTQVLLNATDEVDAEVESEKLPQTVNRLLRSDATMVNPQGEGSIRIADYLQQNGINENNVNAILDPQKANVKNEVLKSLYAADVVQNESELSKIWSGATGFIRGLFTSPVPAVSQQTAAIYASAAYSQEEERQTGKARRRLAKLSGEDFISEKTPLTNDYLRQVRSTGAYRETANQIYPNPFVAIVQNIADPDIAGQFVDRRDYDRRLSEKLTQNKTVLQQGNFAIAPKTSVHEEVWLAINGSDPSLAGRLDKDSPINIRVNPSDPSQVIVSQRQKDGKDWNIAQVPVYLQNIPQTASSIDFNNQRNMYSRETFTGLREPISILTTKDAVLVHDIAENVYMQNTGDVNTAINMARMNNTKEGITSTLNQSFPNLFYSNGQPTKYGVLSQQILNDKNLQIEADPTNLGVVFSISKNGQKLYSFDNYVPYANLDEAVEKAKYTPAELVSSMLSQMASERQTYGTEGIYNEILSAYQQ